MKLAVSFILAFMSAPVSAQGGVPLSDHDQEEFFEQKVRPVLAENCFACHGPEKQKAGLRLDSREAALKGSSSTAVILPGDPDKSPLIRAVNYQGDVHMPPQGKLPAPMIEALWRWVRLGAPWPAGDKSTASSQPSSDDQIEKRSASTGRSARLNRPRRPRCATLRGPLTRSIVSYSPGLNRRG